AHGWMHSLTLPRVLTFRDGRLYSSPAAELGALRVSGTQRDFHVQRAEEMQFRLHEGTEIRRDFDLGNAAELTTSLCWGEEKLIFRYNRRMEIMTIDRTNMKRGGRGTRSFKLESDGPFSMTLFIDRSIVEAFFQDGIEAATIAVFPDEGLIPSLKISSSAELPELKGEIWELSFLRYVTNL
ncbi:MAG: GH32 C-terminal domain-containing protein, partial [Oscillospiraceae bacterium]|nr:GH32 C-terminal domain-containing protein [Oscillospiraceae bacterium]